MPNEPNGLFEFVSYRLNAAKRLATAESLVLAPQMTFAFCSSGGRGASRIALRERDSTICSRDIPQWTESQ